MLSCKMIGGGKDKLEAWTQENTSEIQRWMIVFFPSVCFGLVV